MEYQQKMRNGGDSTLPKIRNTNQYSKSYFGPDDDYWYEQNKKTPGESMGKVKARKQRLYGRKELQKRRKIYETK